MKKYDGHTPGPWILHDHNHNLQVYAVTNEGCHFEIASADHPYCGGLPPSELQVRKANARLIADSPKILAALVKIVEADDALTEELRKNQVATDTWSRAVYNAIDEARKLIQEEQK